MPRDINCTFVVLVFQDTNLLLDFIYINIGFRPFLTYELQTFEL